MTISREHLEPCPFCGGAAGPATKKATFFPSRFKVSCSDSGCGAHFGYWSPNEWNRRAQAAPEADPVAWVTTAHKSGVTEQRSLWNGEDGADTWIEHFKGRGCEVSKTPLYTAPQHDADWREHSKQYAKGEKCPQTIEALQAAWDRDQELMMDQKAEISRLKEKLNRAEQRNKPHDAELVELLREVVAELEDWRMSFPDANSLCTDNLLPRINAKLATLRHV